MTIRSAKVPQSPSSALQHDVLAVGLRVEDRLPLDAGREAGAAAAAQARAVTSSTMSAGAQGQRASRPA